MVNGYRVSTILSIFFILLIGIGVSLQNNASGVTGYQKSLVFPIFDGKGSLTLIKPYLISGDVVLLYSSSPVQDTASFKTGFFANGVKYYSVYASSTGIKDIEAVVKNLPAGYEAIFDDYEDCNKTQAKCDTSFDPSEAKSIAIFQRAQTAVNQYNTRTGSHAFLFVSASYNQVDGDTWDWSQLSSLFASPNLLSIQTQTGQESDPNRMLGWAQHAAQGLNSFDVQVSLQGNHTPIGAIALANLMVQVPQVSGVKIFGTTNIQDVLNVLRPTGSIITCPTGTTLQNGVCVPNTTNPLSATLTVTPSSGNVSLTVTSNVIVSGGKSPYVISTYFGDNTNTQNGNNIIHVFNKIGNFTVTATIIDQLNNNFVTSKLVSVKNQTNSIKPIVPATVIGISQSETHDDIEYSNSTHVATFHSDPYIKASNGTYVPYIVSQNSTHYIIDNRISPFVINKNNCMVSQYNTIGLITSQTKPVIGREWWDIIATRALTNQTAEFNTLRTACNLNIITNNTGIFISYTKTLPFGTMYVLYDKITGAKIWESTAKITNTDQLRKNFYFYTVERFQNLDADSIQVGNVTQSLSNNKTIQNTASVPTNKILFKKSGQTQFSLDLRKAIKQMDSINMTKRSNGTEIKLDFGKNPTKLDVGQSTTLDPTFSSAHSNDDESLANNGQSGGYCGIFGSFESYEPPFLTFAPSQSNGGACWIAIFNIPITGGVPVGANITKLTLITRPEPFAATPPLCDADGTTTIIPTLQDDTTEDHQLWAAALGVGSDKFYVMHNNFCANTGAETSVDLNSKAISDFNYDNANGRPFILFVFEEHLQSFGFDPQLDPTIDRGAQMDYARLQVKYQTTSTNLFAKQSDNSTAVVGQLKNFNSTFPNGATVNLVNGNYTYRNLSGLQNVTVKETAVSNYFVYKDINLNGAVNKTKTYVTHVYKINCPSKGSDKQLQMFVNESNYHYITNFQTPICGSSNIVLTSLTFNPNGQTNQVGTSQLLIKVLNTTAFNANPFQFDINGIIVPTSYSSPIITSSPFTISDGLTPSTLTLEVQMTNPPSGEGGGVSGGGGGGSAGVPLSNLDTNSGLGPIIVYSSPKLFLQVGSALSGNILTNWSEAKNLTISTIKVADNSPVGLTFTPSPPFVLRADPAGNSKQYIPFQVNAPSIFCSITNQTFGGYCLDPSLNTISVPLTIEASIDGKLSRESFNLQISVQKNQKVADYTLLILVVLAVIGIAVGSYAGNKRKGKRVVYKAPKFGKIPKKYRDL